MRRELAKLEAEADSARARIDELDSGEIEKVLLETQALGRKQGEIAQLRNRLDQFNLEREMVLKNTESLENNTTILIGTSCSIYTHQLFYITQIRMKSLSENF